MTESKTVISVSNHKGGVGKTTLSAHTAAALSKKGHNVLLIDGDPQGTLSMHLTPTIESLRRYRDKDVLDISGRTIQIARSDGPDVGLDLEKRLPSVYEAFYGQRREDSIAIRLVSESKDEYREIAEDSGFEPGSITENLAVETTDGPDIIPANGRLQGIETALSSNRGAVMCLNELIGEIEGTAGNPDGEEYDYILIDTPASVGILKDAAAIAAGNFIVPMQAEGTSVSHTLQHLKDIEGMSSSFGFDANILGIVPNEVRNDGEAKKVLNIVRKQVPDPYIRTHDVPEDFDDAQLPDEFWLGKSENDDGELLDGVPQAFEEFWPEMGCRPYITEKSDYTEDVTPFEILTRVAIRRAFAYNTTIFSQEEECDQIEQFDRLAERVIAKTED